MGILQHSPPGTVSPLFSPVQARLLAILFSSPDRQFQSNELIRLAAAGTGATHRQLQRFSAAGLLTVNTIGSQKFYQANRSSPIFQELRSIVLKTVALGEPLRRALEPLRSEILTAFVFGSMAQGTATDESDIDLMVLSNSLDYSQVFDVLQSVEDTLGRRINPTVISGDQWTEKRRDSNSFVSRVALGPRIWIIGDDADLP